MKLYKELRLQGNHCLYTFIESEVRNDQVHKVEKVTKINSRIISKPRAYLQNRTKTEQNFIGNYKAPATPRWHKSKPYKYKIQEAYKTHTCIIYTAENLNIGSLSDHGKNMCKVS